jgi:putative DNA methylase
MGYDEKLTYCDRPEQIEGPSEAAWDRDQRPPGHGCAQPPGAGPQLGERRFGHVPRVGDAFCGGGSVPFEAARIGCEAYGSDLNPVAALLTWGALNIVGGGEAVAKQVREAQEQVYAAVDPDHRLAHRAQRGWAGAPTPISIAPRPAVPSAAGWCRWPRPG